MPYPPAKHSREIAMNLVGNIENQHIRRVAESSLRGGASMNLMVKAFHDVYGLPIIPPANAKANFSHITKERLAMRFGLIVEEFMELCEAMDIRADINFFYHDEEGQYVSAGGDVLTAEDHDSLTEDDHTAIVRKRVAAAITETDERNLPEIADATFDMKYVLIGFEYEIGIDPQFCAEEGQASNMSKLMPDGSVKRREDGKVLKGPNYFKPDMALAQRSWGMRDV